jgi:hypothetical protein
MLQQSETAKVKKDAGSSSSIYCRVEGPQKGKAAGAASVSEINANIGQPLLHMHAIAPAYHMQHT